MCALPAHAPAPTLVPPRSAALLQEAASAPEAAAGSTDALKVLLKSLVGAVIDGSLEGSGLAEALGVPPLRAEPQRARLGADLADVFWYIGV